MRFLRPASEDEVVAAFLRAEADDTGRYRARIHGRLRSDGEPVDVVAGANHDWLPPLVSGDENRAIASAASWA